MARWGAGPTLVVGWARRCADARSLSNRRGVSSNRRLADGEDQVAGRGVLV